MAAPRIPSLKPEDVQLVDIDSVRPWPGNPRRGDVDKLRAMYREFGQQRTIIVQRSSGLIIAGNHWWQAMKAEGAAAILVGFCPVNDLTAQRIAVADNQSHEVGTYDSHDLDVWLRNLWAQGGLDETLGYSHAQLDAYLRQFGGGGGRGSPDAAPDPPLVPWVQAGSLIALGEHRLFVGDSRNAAGIEALFAESPGVVGAIWTDPPYGANYVGRVGRDNRKKIANDELAGEALAALLRDSLALALAQLEPGRAVYVHGHAGAPLARFLDVAVEQGWYRQTLAWTKDTFVVGRADFHYQWEPLLYGWRSGASHVWHGDRKQSTVWAFDRPKANDLHPTQKPVALVEHVLALSTEEGEVVFDPFAGSGTAVIAAERAGRVAYCVEQDPAYAQVIVERFEANTGQQHQVLAVREDLVAA